MKYSILTIMLCLLGCQPVSMQRYAQHDHTLPRNYRVHGQTYHVLNTAYGYHARGLASWYGRSFQSKRTSSGERYNMYALTAAHRTLPLHTYLHVKNLNNGRSIIVKINDRGPFHSNRIIDLSYGAALKLGLFPKGTALVEVKAVPRP